MNWFLVKLTYRFTCGSGKHAAQFNEQTRLINADDVLHAFHKARLIGERETTEITKANFLIRWTFLDVTDITPLEGNVDGIELCSCIKEDANADAYIRNTTQKANALLQESIAAFTNVNRFQIV